MRQIFRKYLSFSFRFWLWICENHVSWARSAKVVMEVSTSSPMIAVPTLTVRHDNGARLLALKDARIIRLWAIEMMVNLNLGTIRV